MEDSFARGGSSIRSLVPQQTLQNIRALSKAANSKAFGDGAWMGHAFDYPLQVEMLLNFSASAGPHDPVNAVCEIGFNAGFSAALLLARNNAELHEFDMLENRWSNASVTRFRTLMPGRLDLHAGDSVCTVPRFIAEQRRHAAAKTPCDRFFVDGFHEEPHCRLDMLSAVRATRPGGLIIADDATSRFPEVKPAWTSFVESGFIENSRCDARNVNHKVGMKGFCWGTRTTKPAKGAFDTTSLHTRAHISLAADWLRRDARAGFCGATKSVSPTKQTDGWDLGSCAADSSATSGSWRLSDPELCNARTLAAACLLRCSRCARCSHVSFSVKHRDCAWFSEAAGCDVAASSKDAHMKVLAAAFVSGTVPDALKRQVRAAADNGEDRWVGSWDRTRGVHPKREIAAGRWRSSAVHVE